MPRDLPQAFAFILGFWIALCLSPFVVRASRSPLPTDAPWAALETRFHAEVNLVRTRRHLVTLEREPILDAVARAHSEDMASRGYLSHVNPEGLNPLDRIEAAGITGFTLAAENAGQTDLADPNGEILRGWIQSRVHRENLYAPPFNRTGVGIARAADGTWYYTQLYVSVPR